MARDFAARGDITPPGGDFPDGRLLDSSPPSAKNGTSLEESLLGDMTQFFLKILRDASIAENGLPDNETNGYQLVQALENRIGALGTPAGSIGTAQLADRAVTFPKFRSISESRIMGRQAGGGAGDMEQMTVAQALALLNITPYQSWTPTFTNNTPAVINTPTLNGAKFQRIDNAVYFGIFCNIGKLDPDALGLFDIDAASLPIPSSFTNVSQGFGLLSNTGTPSNVGTVRSDNGGVVGAAHNLNVIVGGIGDPPPTGSFTQEYRITGHYEIIVPTV